jgi:hypothetical protein
MKQAVGLRWENGAMNPGRLPWAGMSQAVGLKPPAPSFSRDTRARSAQYPQSRKIMGQDFQYDVFLSHSAKDKVAGCTRHCRS